jgi:2-methylcitrate dehydratase PrpD
MKWQPGGFEYLPPDVVHTTKLFVLDTLGSLAAERGRPVSRKFAAA